MRTKLTFLTGALAGSAFTAVALTVGAAGLQALRAPEAQAAAQKAGAKAGAIKYSTQVVFENDRVRVKDVTFPAGVLDTGMHTHELAHVGVILTEGTLLFTEPDGKKETASFTAGSVGFRAANATHQVASPGPKPMRVIEVELK